jgi:lysophospholipid acyltransferase (LPLAT)-like uncharacterized protein
MPAWEEFRWKTAGMLGRLLLRLWAGSSRIRVIGEDNYLRCKAQKKPVIFLVWHGRLFLAPYFFRKRGIFALVSPSRDGEIIARIASGWGFRIIRGSGSHSMVRAWLEMKNRLRAGAQLIIIPDGPRGPDRVFKPGGLKLAQETGAILQPFSFSASRKRLLKSWDRFLLFYPFSKIVAVYGSPITVDPAMDEGSFERARLEVERALTALDASADSHFEKR